MKTRTLAIVIVIACVAGTLSGAPQATLQTSFGLAGTVRSESGEPLEGVAVSARIDIKPYITISVYTDQKGRYFFPPLKAGHYKLWAQAIGFQADKAESEISTGNKAQQDFTLRTLADFQKQLSGAEWMESLSNVSPGDKRLTSIFEHNCLGCHTAGFALQNAFDAAGWRKIVNYMEKAMRNGDLRADRAPADPITFDIVEQYKDELVDFLARLRGPQPSALKYKAFPRVTGEAARVVVTEYSLPRGDRPDDYVTLLSHDGSDWSEGTPHKEKMSHDLDIDRDGIVWFSDNDAPERTIGRLDPKTGHVTSYKLADKEGLAVGTHSIAVDQKGNIWAPNNTEGTILKFDPKIEKFQRFPAPSSINTGGGGNTISIDSKGNVWATAGREGGAFRLNPETGEYTVFNAVSKGYAYGITIDGQDNVWFAQEIGDRIGIVNGRTGKVSEVVLPPLDDSFITAKDLEIGARLGCCSNTNNQPLYRKGPRRLAADRRGNTVWVADSFANRLTKVDGETKKVTDYSLPHPYMHPYAVSVDKYHMVWVNLGNADRVVKFNPYTERFTEYPLPTLGTQSKSIVVEDRSDSQTIWVSYAGVAKMGSIRLRTASTSR